MSWDRGLLSSPSIQDGGPSPPPPLPLHPPPLCVRMPSMSIPRSGRAKHTINPRVREPDPPDEVAREYGFKGGLVPGVTVPPT
jgi:hypothetical protein